jgi:hypothetical protein
LEPIATLNRRYGGENDMFYGVLWFINEGRWAVYEQPIDPDLERNYLAFVDTTTWEPVIDTSGYPFGAAINFNHDYTRYAVGGVGMFAYPSGEKLFDLPEGQTLFSPDSSVIMVRATYLLPRPSEYLVYIFLDGETGTQINRFDISWPVADVAYALNYPLVNADLSLVVMPDVAPGTVGPGHPPVIEGWRVIDVRTNAIVQRIEGGDLDDPRAALGLNSLTTPIINGRYAVQGEGIFDAETDQLILALDGNRLALSPQGTYAVTQGMCTVWELP